MTIPLHSKYKGDILIVDDVPENLQLLFEILSEEGHEVRRVLNGMQAIKAIQVEPPDLILLDIKMPVMDGYEVCSQLKADPLTAAIPIIFLSALNDVLDKAKAFALGGVDYINKPFDVYEVLVRVDNQLKLLQTSQALARQNEELKVLNQDLESFNYMVSHDLRRPLTRLLGFCEFLAEGDMSQEETEEAIAIIGSAGKEMNQIISDLLRLSMIKQQDLHWESVNLSDIAQDILQKLRLSDPDRPVDILLDKDLQVVGDRRLLRIALENLLENAWKYSSRKEKTQIEFVQKENNVFMIRDNGAGFDMNAHQEIFAPFKRLHQDNDFAGTGIGLAIVDRIIQSHQGKIWCEAIPEEGASFFFTINIHI